jgi:hypothetical protein
MVIREEGRKRGRRDRGRKEGRKEKEEGRKERERRKEGRKEDRWCEIMDLNSALLPWFCSSAHSKPEGVSTSLYHNSLHYTF